ncbi:hypothetical protein MSPP1_004206 [Malassezia sp. CBS 17886]|nr:hypothetical protein MSPP1_004206 [Malassezia sp. CBS 17886]
MPGRNAIPVRSAGGAGRGADLGERVRENPSQHPWRSSLDLVWSYARSQAYFGDNITTSPSFVERHWCGDGSGADTDADVALDIAPGSSSSTDTLTIASEEDDDDDARDRVAPPLGIHKYWSAMDAGADVDMRAARDRGRRPSHTDARRPPPPPPPPGDTAGARAAWLTPAEMRYEEGTSDELDEDSLRSRSRSPKRLGGVEKDTGGTRLAYGSDRAPSRPPRDSPPYCARSRSRSQYRAPLRAYAPHLRDPYRVDERSPLVPRLGGARDGVAAAKTARAPGGQSSFWQTWFNTVNVLIGFSILAMPFAFARAGWVGGAALFVACGFLTNHSGKMLGRILARHPHLHTYADIGSFAFGPVTRTCISLFFCCEMWMVSIALLILIGDSAEALVYGRGGSAAARTVFKVCGFLATAPTLFLPLPWLSPVSLVGIVSIAFLLLVIVTDGLLKTHAPGSLWAPAATSLLPDWSTVPISFGIVMSGFSSHPVIPSLFRDMKHPEQFDRMLDLAYLASSALYIGVAIAGYLMFGAHVSNEITRDLARTPGYPYLLTATAVLLMVVNPLSKFALALRPVQTTAERYLHVHEDAEPAPPADADEEAHQSFVQSRSDLQRVPTHGRAAARACRGFPWLARAATRLAIAASVLLVAVLVPRLERIMGFLGAFLTYATCILGPILASMRLFPEERTGWTRARDVGVLGVTFVLAFLGTLASVWPEM